MSAGPQDPLRYQPYYCEENVWWLAGDPGFAACERQVVFISNAKRCCRFGAQRAAPPGHSLFWDYHVVLAVRAQAWQVWDQDSRLGMPVAAPDYLLQSFAAGLADPPGYQARFRVLDAEPFRRDFASDRSHMRAADGSWLHPPPAWDALGSGKPSNLMELVAMDAPGSGMVLDFAQLLRGWGERHGR